MTAKAASLRIFKAGSNHYYCPFGFDVAVVDLDQGLITLIQKDKYFYGKIEGQYVDGRSIKTQAMKW